MKPLNFIFTLETIVISLFMFASCSNKVFRDVHNYESKQFTLNSARKDIVLSNLKRINKKITRANSKDTFWIINYFSVKQDVFGGMYISREDTIYYEKRGNRIFKTKSKEALEGSEEILDFIFNGKELPVVFDGSTSTMILQITKVNKDSIKISGYNLDNSNNIIDKFK